MERNTATITETNAAKMMILFPTFLTCAASAVGLIFLRYTSIANTVLNELKPFATSLMIDTNKTPNAIPIKPVGNKP